MSIIELLLLAIGLSMDAFAVAVCTGLAAPKASIKKHLVVGLYFGVSQAVMPLIGYFAGTLFADVIMAYDHWIAFALLSLLGCRMIYSSFKNEDCSDSDASTSPARMLPLAIATSIDALAVGVSFAFLHVDIVPAVSFIGITTFIISAVGVKVGNIFGTRFKSKAELLGGAILVLTGIKILLDHLGIIS